MNSDDFTYQMHDVVPDQFMAAIGSVMVHHAELDMRLQGVISYLVGMDHNSGIAVLSKVQMTTAKVDIFQNVARTSARSVSQLAKMLVLGDIINDLCAERNVIAHTLPYARSLSKQELTYFKDVNRTYPQIKVQPPYLATVPSLLDLAQRIRAATTWLGMLLPMWKNDVNDPAEAAGPHPDWANDARFPWQERFLGKVQSESRKPQSDQIGTTSPPPPKSRQS